MVGFWNSPLACKPEVGSGAHMLVLFDGLVTATAKDSDDNTTLVLAHPTHGERSARTQLIPAFNQVRHHFS